MSTESENLGFEPIPARDQESKEEHKNPYNVRLGFIVPEDIRKIKLLSFIVNEDTFEIIIGSETFGHNQMIDSYNLDGNDWTGGDIWPAENKITFYCGSLSDVGEGERERVTEAINSALGLHLVRR